MTQWADLLANADPRLRHIEHLPARPGATAPWPDWVPAAAIAAWGQRGITAPWEHQVRAAERAHAGHHVALATGTASGKSLAYLMPIVAAILSEPETAPGRGATALYLAPTKALAHDQLAAMSALSLTGLRAGALDGDTPQDERRWLRAHANVIVTNPDMLHHGLLPGHSRWAAFLRSLRYVVVDECHGYRGVFGSHVALVLRRLRRVAAHYGADPTFICASATTADPAGTARLLTGLPAEVITSDASPRGPMTFALWEPPLLEGGGENDAPVRRGVVAEAADLLSALAGAGTRTLAFTRSRRGAEALAMATRDRLAERSSDPSAGAAERRIVDRVAAYRGGYLPEERRALESALRSGELLAVATTSALELGIDVSGLDAVLLCGWPGTRAALWQQAGRAGRGAQESLAVFIARDDPLDTYVVSHPEAIFGRPVEATVLDPANPHLLGPHLLCAAAEIPLTEPEAGEVFGAATRPLLDDLVRQGLLRARPRGWFWTLPESPAGAVDLRGSAHSMQVVETDTGRLLGTIGAAAAHLQAHAGAVYIHQGATYVVEEFHHEDGVALARPQQIDYTTTARQVSDVRIVASEQSFDLPGTTVHFGEVTVTSQVVSFARRRLVSGELLGVEPLDLPATMLTTRGVWWTLAESALSAAGIQDIGGAAHAAEHAAIGLLPLFASCDRWDIGGVSTQWHPDTESCTIVVYDGHPGGAGFAERGFHSAADWLGATLEAIESCECRTGCPSCVQSPKCGNGNEPLDKAGARALLEWCLHGAV